MCRSSSSGIGVWWQTFHVPGLWWRSGDGTHTEAEYCHQSIPQVGAVQLTSCAQHFSPRTLTSRTPVNAFPDGRCNLSREHDHGDFFVDEVPILIPSRWVTRTAHARKLRAGLSSSGAFEMSAQQMSSRQVQRSVCTRSLHAVSSSNGSGGAVCLSMSLSFVSLRRKGASSPLHKSSHAEGSRRALGFIPFLEDSHFRANFVLRYLFAFSLMSCLFQLLNVCGGAFQLCGCAMSSSSPVGPSESFLWWS